MVKKHARGLLSHFSVRATLSYAPLIAGSVIAAIIFKGTEVDRTSALAALGTEAQVFATFAALTPIFFVFAQFYRRDKRLLTELTYTVISIIGLSVFGIGMCIVSMVTQAFFGFVILLLLLFVGQLAVLMSLFLLSLCGFRFIEYWIAPSSTQRSRRK